MILHHPCRPVPPWYIVATPWPPYQVGDLVRGIDTRYTLLADGRAIDPAEYPELAALLPDGIHVPDLQEKEQP